MEYCAFYPEFVMNLKFSAKVFPYPNTSAIVVFREHGC